MFEVGFTEILLIFAIALLVLGPARLPKLAADIGRWAGRARVMARQLRTQLEQEVHYDPLKDQPQAARTIHSSAPPFASPPEPTPAAEPAPTATPAAAEAPPVVTAESPAAPDRNDEPKPE